MAKEILEKPNTNDFWDYCREVTKEIDILVGGGFSQRWVLNDMNAVGVSFDKKWTPKECAETILERRESLQL